MADDFEWYMRNNGDPVAVKGRTTYTFDMKGNLTPSKVPAHVVEHDCVRITAGDAARLKEKELENARERHAAHARTE